MIKENKRQNGDKAEDEDKIHIGLCDSQNAAEHKGIGVGSQFAALMIVIAVPTDSASTMDMIKSVFFLK
jgi:hypothetical protein